MRTVTYARFSSDKQSDSSIEDQQRNCRRYAERNQLEIGQQFEDRAISGMSKNRPGFKAMLAAAERGEFDVLVVDDLSRFSRDDVEMKQTIRRLKFRGIRVIGASDGYDSFAKGEKIQSSMRGLMNEMFLDDLREKTHRGLYGKALNGYSAGGSIYGYKRRPIENPANLDPNGRPEIVAVARDINDEEAKWVRQIYTWFANGYSPKRIAAELNKLGVPSPRGSTWAASAIYGDSSHGNGMLNNSIYVGQYIWNRSAWIKNPDTGRRRRVARPKEEWMVKAMPELRIVPQELWDAVQNRQNEIRQKSTALRQALNNPNTRSRTGKFLFSGLLKCGTCNASYTVCSVCSYGCSTNINRGSAACANKLRVTRKIVEVRLLEAIRNDLLSQEAIDLFVTETNTLLKQAQAERHPDTEGLRRDLKRVEGEVNNLLAAIKAGIFTTATKAELERGEAERSRLTALVNTTEDVTYKLAASLPDAAARYKALVADLGATLARDVAVARQALKMLVGEVKLNPRPEGYLEAELQHSHEGLLALALGPDVKVRMVAGGGFEPPTFRL
jgi:site-specific DNA recombinase